MSLVKKFLNPKNDVAFKKIFGTEKNQDILITMLNAVLKKQLHKPIKEVQFLSPIQEPEALAKKQSIVDVLCKDEDGCQYVIEMQLANAKGFQERAQYYACKAFISQMKEGQAYENLKEVIFLAFCSFPIFKHKKHYKSEHITIDKKTGEHDLDKLSFTFIDLIKFDKTRSKAIEDLSLEEKFYYFLHHGSTIDEGSLRTLIGQDVVIKNAFKALERYAWTDDELCRYEQELKRVRDNQACLSFAQDQGVQKGIAEGRREGIAEGEERGRKERNQEIARELLILGIDDKTIITSTGLTRQWLGHLKNEIKENKS
ncbi:MAG: Rpn family recombination-promoting nuclease/putative transposase [Bacteroidota bacterium]